MRSRQKNANLVLAMLLIHGISIAQSTNKNTQNREVMTSETEKNKEVVRTLYENAFNKRKLELLAELISDDYTGIRGAKGAAGFGEPLRELIKGFPDMQWKVSELFGEGNKVTVKWKVTGTHTATFTGYAATGKTVSSDGMAIYELRDGKVIATQVLTDRLGFLQQLEVLPADLTALRKTAGKERVYFIDKFLIPAAAKTEFHDRMRINRDFIKALPGFVEDAAYEYTDAGGNLVCVTVAQWENMEALNNAKASVQAEYKKQGFDPAAMFQRLNISADRGIYNEVD